MTRHIRYAAVAAAFATLAACSPEQRDTIDSAAGSAANVVQAELSVLNIDMGKKAGTDRKISEDADTFAPRDTIFASVNTTGTVRDGAIKAQWRFPDGSVIDQNAEPVVGDGDANLLFFITKAEGLPTGKYTFRVLVDGREVRTKDVTVQ